MKYEMIKTKSFMLRSKLENANLNSHDKDEFFNFFNDLGKLESKNNEQIEYLKSQIDDYNKDNYRLKNEVNDLKEKLNDRKKRDVSEFHDVLNECKSLIKDVLFYPANNSEKGRIASLLKKINSFF